MTMEPTFLISFITAVFSFGTSLFYVLTCVERATLPLVWNRVVAEADIRFTHQALKRLAPLLPPSNGFVILFGFGSLITQGIALHWEIRSLVVLVYYLLLNIYIIFIGQIVKDVKNLKETESTGDLSKVTSNVKKLIFNHHLGLFANLGVVSLELILFTKFL